MTEESKEVTTTQNQQTAITVAQRMQDMGIDAKDLAIPRLLLMQPTSELVGAEKAKTADIVHSMTEEVIGGMGKPIEIIPMMLYKTLVVEDMTQKPPKFLRQEPLTSKNDSLPFEGTEDGKAIKRTTCFNFFCLIASEVANDEAFPTVVRFKSTSLQAGKALASHMFKRAALGQDPFSQAVTLDTKKDKKDTNVYALFAIGKARKASDKEIAAARQWFGSLEAMKAKVDAIAEGSEISQGGAAPTVVEGSAEDASRF